MLCVIAFLVGCGGDTKKEVKKSTPKVEKKSVTIAEKKPASQRIDLENKGVGPIKEVVLAPEVDQAMAEKGKEVYKQMCMACHKPDQKFIGPAPVGVLSRRSPEWVMNMILNPDVMVKEDPLAKELLKEFNGSPMANQGLTEEQARQILEYFRTL